MTGYLGRVGIFEVLNITGKIKGLIAEKADAEKIKKTALDEGMTILRENAIKKMRKGITTYNDVLRVISGD